MGCVKIEILSEVPKELVESNVKSVVDVIQADSILPTSGGLIASDTFSVSRSSNLAIKESSYSILLEDSILVVISDNVQSICANLDLGDIEELDYKENLDNRNISTNYTDKGGNINLDYKEDLGNRVC
jgi:hypothetical protein